MESYRHSPAMLPKDYPLEALAHQADPSDRETGNPRDRRCEPRIVYEQRVMAHDREASRILIGRDLAVGGLRVDPHPELTIGKTMRVSIHIGSGDPPISLRARVLRDDGARGVALRFVDMSMSSEEQLRKFVQGTPRIEETCDEGEEEVVLTEILLEEEV
jgi:hypothetical protein